MPQGQDDNQDSFAALFEAQPNKDKIRRRLPRVGEPLEATVVQIGRDTVFVELDGKRQAQIDVTELRGPDGQLTVAVGDTVRATVVAVDPGTGDVRLARSMGRAGNLAAIEQAKEAGLPVEGRVTGVNKGGLEIDLGGARGFCPISHADTKYVQDAASLIGKSLSFLVTEIKDGGRSVTVSRRALLEREGREAVQKRLRDIVPGAVLHGTVSAVRDFGAFVDLDGVEGLIPASELTHDRGATPMEAVRVGEGVTVQVLEVKEAPSKKPGEGPVTRITLSLKALAKDPWDDLHDALPEGTIVAGVVTRVAEFGAFVKLLPGIEGLLHVSELGSGERARGLAAGEKLVVVVRAIDRVKRKISLAPAPEGMNAGARVQPARFEVGMTVTGKVDRIETYGIFLQIAGTSGRAGRGLVPNAELGVPRGTDLRKAFPLGTTLTAKVLEIAEGKLRLSLKAAKDDEERSHYEGYAAASTSKMGTLGDLLRARGVGAGAELKKKAPKR